MDSPETPPTPDLDPAMDHQLENPITLLPYIDPDSIPQSQEEVDSLKVTTPFPGAAATEQMVYEAAIRAGKTAWEKDVLEREKHQQEAHIQELQSETEKHRKEAITDSLTGVPNRRGFEAAFHRTAARARRTHSQNVLLHIDVDWFKQVNDQLGHLTGDELLRSIANILKEQTREEDVVARTGGDEFSVLLENTDLKGGVETAERFLTNVAGLPSYPKAPSVKPTLSIGVGPIDPFESLEANVMPVDGALYQAKEKRNCVVPVEPITQSGHLKVL